MLTAGENIEDNQIYKTPPEQLPKKNGGWFYAKEGWILAMGPYAKHPPPELTEAAVLGEQPKSLISMPVEDNEKNFSRK